MMQRQRKTLDPCPRCRVHRSRCICHEIPRLTCATRLSLVIHHRELKRTTNTGALAVHALTNSALFVRGRMDEDLDLDLVLAPGYQSVLLYPDDDAVDLASITTGPVNLVVPDGNWRQAGKVHRRHPRLGALPRVKLKDVNEGLNHLRAEHFAEGRSTLEAIARAFDVLESRAAGRALLNLYGAKLRATLAGRGVISPTS